MNQFVNSKTRDFKLPGGCKDLIDVLEKRRRKQAPLAGRMKHIEAYLSRALQSKAIFRGLIISSLDYQITIMNWIKVITVGLFVSIAIASARAQKWENGLVVAKVFENGKHKYVIGKLTDRKPPLNTFLQSAHVVTNLTGAAQWVAATNLNSLFVIRGTPDMFLPPATNVIPLSAEEWLTIFPRR